MNNDVIAPEPKMTKVEKWNLRLGIFSLLVATGALIVAIWSIKSSEHVAEKSGAFDKGNLQLSFAGYLINSDNEFDVYYGVNFADSSLHFGNLPIGIHNLGKKTLDNVNMIIKYPHMAHIALNNKDIKMDTIITNPIERQFYTVEPFDVVAYKCGSINPKFSLPTYDAICFNGETSYNKKIDVKTKDNMRVTVPVAFQYGYSVSVNLTAKDASTENYSFVLRYFNESNIDSLINKAINEKVNSENKDKVNKSFFVIIPANDKQFGKGKDKVTQTTFSPDNAVLCEFDTKMERVLIINSDGSPLKQIVVK